MKKILLIVMICASLFTQLVFAQKSVICVKKSKTTFQITLPSNPTTGYSWGIQSYNAKLLTLKKHDYLRSESQALGAGGVERWTFKVKPLFNQTKQTKITFVYRRPWEKNQNTKVTTIKISRCKT